MNPENQRHFEEHLRQARPHAFDPVLKERIQNELRIVARRQRIARFRSSAGWAGLAIAATILITFGFLLFNGRISLQDLSPDPPLALQTEPEPDPVVSDPADKTSPFKPVLTQNNLQSRIDEGIVFLKNGMTARRYRYQFVDRVVWENPADGAMVELEVPRDEIVLIPVQTF
jgi:hypothetical protein